ncbi:MAG: APC family permease [Pseudobdellovibrionaceae bacterium]
MLKLERTMGPWQASSIVMGTIIGTGIFLKTATMMQLVGSMSLVTAAWIISGILSYAGALTYAELSSYHPEAGGEYAFLKAGYGPLFSFLYGWMRFWIGAPGSIAAYAAGTSTFLSGLISLDFIPGGSKSVAVFLILFFSAINCLKVHWGARLQTFLTALKIILILGLVIGVFFFRHSNYLSTLTLAPAKNSFDFQFGSFGMAMIAALWAFDGWNNLPMVSEEIKNPKRNIPIALGFGVLAVMMLYLSANWAYFKVLSIEQIQTANSSAHPQALPVATLAAKSFLGDWGIPAISIAFMISALGAMNGSILTAARVPFAMARDGLFWKRLGSVSKQTHVPVWSIIIQGIIASGLTLLGTFDQLTDYVVAAAWIFYGLTASTVFISRNHKSGIKSESEFKVPGYPFVPAVFIITALLLVINSMSQNLLGGLIGLAIIAAGGPIYYLLSKKSAKATKIEII